MQRPRLIVLSAVALLLVLALVAVLAISRSIRREQAQIRARYQQMRTALSSSDTNAALALVAPQYRGGFDGYRFSMLNDFAEALGPRSSIVVLRDEAIVWPVRTSHYQRNLGSSLNFQQLDFSVIWRITDSGDGGRSRGCDGPGILA